MYIRHYNAIVASNQSSLEVCGFGLLFGTGNSGFGQMSDF